MTDRGERMVRRLECGGIPILGTADTEEHALWIGCERVSRMLRAAPKIAHNMRTRGVEVHVIGPTTAFSSLQHLDSRGDGRGICTGLVAAVGAENLLDPDGLRKMERRQRGRDILTHEFAHLVMNHGLDAQGRESIQQQFDRSKGLWDGAYAATNAGEYFAELSMWYFNSQGSCPAMAHPGVGPAGLLGRDPEGFALLGRVFSDHLPVIELEAPLENLDEIRRTNPRSGHAGRSNEVLFELDLSTGVRDGERYRLNWVDSEGTLREYGQLTQVLADLIMALALDHDTG